MNIEEFRTYCLYKKGVSEDFPFDESTLVYKVKNKIFALTDLEGDFRINLKCEPQYAIELREEFPAVIPGYHMNKKHWNTIIIDGSITDNKLQKLIDHSYDLVAASLSKKDQVELKNKKAE